MIGYSHTSTPPQSVLLQKAEALGFPLFRFPSGERMPLLVRRSIGLPMETPSYWLTSERRPLGTRANTPEKELRN